MTLLWQGLLWKCVSQINTKFYNIGIPSDDKVIRKISSTERNLSWLLKTKFKWYVFADEDISDRDKLKDFLMDTDLVPSQAGRNEGAVFIIQCSL